MRWSKSVSLVALFLVAVLIVPGVTPVVGAPSGGGAADRVAPQSTVLYPGTQPSLPPGQVVPPPVTPTPIPTPPPPVAVPAPAPAAVPAPATQPSASPGQVTEACRPLNLNLSTGQSAIGAVDPNWKLVSAPASAASPPPTAAYTVGAYPGVGVFPAWYVPSSGNWISPFPRDYIGPVGDYIYETTFSVSSLNTNIVLHVDVYGGDNSLRLTLDGSLIGSPNVGYNVSPISPFPVGGPFVVPLQPGTHVLRATVSNFPSIPSPTGLLVVARVTADCAIAPASGRIIVDKVTIPAGDPTAFQFTASYPPGSFSLTDTALPNDSGLIPSGQYQVSEPAVSGWTTIIICTDPTGNTTVTGNRASIGLDAGETITCTFTNRKIDNTGTIVIVKNSVPNDSQVFNFSMSSFGAFSLDDDGINNNPLSNTRTFANLQPDLYTVTELFPITGWYLLHGSVCKYPDGSTTAFGSQATINLAAGATVTCTFTNYKAGRVIVNKVTVPAGDPTVFRFTGAWASFPLKDGQTYDSGPLSPTGQDSFFYALSETSVSGWTTSLACTDPDGGTTVGPTAANPSVPTSSANIDLDPGETVTCTFTNRKIPPDGKTGAIVIIKDAQPDGPLDFEFGGSWGQFFLDDDGINNNPLSNTQTFSNLAPGTYTIKENVPSGWVLSIACKDPDGGTTVADYYADIDLDAGETVTCIFTNKKTDVPPPPPTTYIYSVKIVCGTVTPPRPKPSIPTLRDPAPVVPGLYRTAVNIHNFWEKETTFLQKVAIALPQDQSRGPVTK
ncbi:MAG: hypothetical protein HY671_00130, partial [Chloroflexi bacterium]|nr:hypothetical protein [Chloroflexota bacterium]